jgi:ribosome maturation factor RimP
VGLKAHFLHGLMKYMSKIDPELNERLTLLISSMGYELVGCELLSMGRQKMFRLYIDAPTGVTADDCSKVSHQVSALMDVEDPIQARYVLEVSSPGIDRPLFALRHYEQFIGSEVKMRLCAPIGGRRQYRGIVKRVEGEDIYLHIEGSGLEVVVPFSSIERANVIGKATF